MGSKPVRNRSTCPIAASGLLIRTQKRQLPGTIFNGSSAACAEEANPSPPTQNANSTTDSASVLLQLLDCLIAKPPEIFFD